MGKGKKVAIIHDKTPYGQGLADETKKALNAASGFGFFMSRIIIRSMWTTYAPFSYMIVWAANGAAREPSRYPWLIAPAWSVGTVPRFVRMFLRRSSQKRS